MKTLARGIVVLAALSAAPALAADLPVKAQPIAKVFDWTGCYVGVHVGGGWQGSSYNSLSPQSGAGFLGGGQAGCNYQIRQFVVGVEAEVWGSTLYDRDAFSEETFTHERTARNRWDAGVSLRAGWAIDNALIYGKLGVVWGRFDYKHDDTDPSDPSTFTERGSAVFPGLLVGLGFEYALTPNWSAKFEYNYINYGNRLVGFNFVDCFAGLCDVFSESATVKEVKQLAKIGLNYRFGQAGPMVAFAAAMPLKGVAVPRAFDWTGCYVGVHAGGGVQSSSFAQSGLSGFGGLGSGFGGLGAVGGVQAGCNYQWKRFVVGLEGEFWGSSLADEVALVETDFSGRNTARNRWDGAISARVGVAFDRALVYGKVGGVWGRFDYDVLVTDGPEINTANASANFAGVLIGAGFEYALTDNWTAKFEYNYIDYGNKLVNFTTQECDPLCVTDTFGLTVKEVKQIAKVGLNYKFAGRGYTGELPVVSKGLPTKGPAPLPRMFDWTGCYVGVHVGGGWQGSSLASVGVNSGVGVIGGGQAGCNYQWRRFVIGLEGEFWGSTLYDRFEIVQPITGTFDQQSHNRWDATVAVRSGLAIEDAFIYAKLGVAWGRFDYSLDLTAFTLTQTLRGSAVLPGVLLGVGVEYALTGNWTAKFEYNYIDFGNRQTEFDFSVCNGAVCQQSSGSQTFKEVKQIAKIGLNYKLGNPAGSSAMAAYASAAPVAVNWTGCYIGVHAGGGWQGSSFTSFGAFGGVGPLGGGQAGCNYQWQQFVIGIEGEIWGSGLYDNSDSSQTVPLVGSVTNEFRSRNLWDAGISARVGYAFERAFLYGKLGGVWGKFDYRDHFVDPVGDTDTTSGSATFAGVLIGAGFEYALVGNWTAKFEYNYIDYGERSVTFTDVECIGGACVTIGSFTENHKERKQIAKLGVNYRFGAR